MSQVETLAIMPTGVHLVGSIPLKSTADVLATASSRLPYRLRRIPDGETGFRYYWINWQISRLEHLPAMVFKDPRIPDNEAQWDLKAEAAWDAYDGLWKSEKTEMSKADKVKLVRGLPAIETAYDDHALASWAVFKEMKARGEIPQGTRFQVSLPTPVAIINIFIQSGFKALMEPVYTEALVRSLRKIQAQIPKQELAVQWDVAVEIGMLEGVPGWDAWWGDGRGVGAPDRETVMKGICERLATAVGFVDEEVEVGLHLCYGDAGHKHFKEPKDLGLIAELVERTLALVERKVDFVHMPVPKDRDDKAYFAPLESVMLNFENEGGTELYLGLVHAGDEEGTKTRIEIAQKVLGSRFGIATECGIGRTPAEHLDSILSISGSCSQPWKDLDGKD